MSITLLNLLDVTKLTQARFTPNQIRILLMVSQRVCLLQKAALGT